MRKVTIDKMVRSKQAIASLLLMRNMSPDPYVVNEENMGKDVTRAVVVLAESLPDYEWQALPEDLKNWLNNVTTRCNVEYERGKALV